ncbi:MAG: beta-propeller fold lactonase family protein [Planctomycetes bacterium]|nr:beta-propeller fold lactonase family protein [Planctomycetota bacterium]
MRRRKYFLLTALVFLSTSGILRAQDKTTPPISSYDSQRVGDKIDGRIVVPTNQVLSPLGRQVVFSGRPTDVALSPNGRWLAALDRRSAILIEVESGEIVSRAAIQGGSYQGIVFTPDGRRLITSCIKGHLDVFSVSEDGQLKKQDPIHLPALRDNNALPAGLTIDAQGHSLWVVLNLNNTLAEILLKDGSLVREIPVGSAPYDVVLVGAKAYVSNWAGRHPVEGDTTGPAGKGTDIRVDSQRHIASDGSVSVVDLPSGKELTQLEVGLHPSGMAATSDGRFVCVANANSDTVSVIDCKTDTVVETISTRPSDQFPFGSTPNDLVLSDDGRTLYVSNGTNNCIAVIDFKPPHSRLRGSFPTGWYPAGLALDKDRDSLYVANIKGVGSRNKEWQGNRKIKGEAVFGYNSHDYLGTVSLIPIPKSDQLAGLTKTVQENNRLTETVNALAPPRKNISPQPIPQRHGEPSLFKHVLYIIKENRTYDQVFGDIKRGEGDASLCIFGGKVTPNHHKLVDEFVLLDNFYCSGTLSADGHQWSTEAYVTDYLEKAYGGWPRSYPYDGGDAMAYAPSGFLWDNVLEHGKSLRVYGEFVKAKIRWKDPAKPQRPMFLDCYRDFLEGNEQIDIRAYAAIKTIEPYLCPTAIGFPSIVPDIHRAEQFMRELKEFEKNDNLPNFMIMLLPNDHTAGTRPGMPTPEAAVADNDLALGRVIEAVTHSKFWPETCIFVVQDDPQAGFDHIDGHRTVAMVISPYTRRQVVDSTNYNQTSMIRTMELILGLPPMNQFDASATAMASCFTDQLDLTPYESVPNIIPLDQMNPEVESIHDPRQRHWALASLAMPLDDVDEADEDTLNRVLWHAVRGRDDTYPAWAVLGESQDEEEGGIE